MADILKLSSTDHLMIDEHAEPHDGNYKPFAHPYYQRLKGFMGARASLGHASFPPGTFAPGVAPKAYKFPSNLGIPTKSTTKYGIVSLGGNIPKSDVTSYCTQSKTLAPNLKVMAISGADTTNDPGGANVENNLDWQMILQAWNAAYPNVAADITMMIGPNSANGIADCVTALVKLGCTVISISWGAAKTQWTAASLTYTEAAFAAAKAKGVFIDAASGDNSANDDTGSKVLDYPSASVNAWGVGGTALTVNAAGEFVSEKAWGDGKPGDEGGGGGFDTTTPIPVFQQGVVSGSFRGGPDSSANADPQTGYQMYSDGKWLVIGGTSASAPLTAGLFGVVLAMGGTGVNFQMALYGARKTAFTDCTVGSNGDPAAIGWDPASGLGSPVGPGVAAALGVGTVIQPPPPPTGVLGSFLITADQGKNKFTGKFVSTSGQEPVVGGNYKLSN